MDQKIPVILDTDIGDDIDDTWALGFLLKCPELDFKYLLTGWGPTRERAKIACKFLEFCDRSDVAVGIGQESNVLKERMYHKSWSEDYDLSKYPGPLHEDGIDSMIKLIMESEQIITLICIGPMLNIAEAVKRQPKIASKTKIVAMLGSIRSGWLANSPPVSEYNVICSTKSAQRVFKQWKGQEIILTPLDTCGRIQISDQLYTHLKTQAEAGKTKEALAIFENFKEWTLKRHGSLENKYQIFASKTSTLFDTVAVHLAFSTKYLEMEELYLKIENDGKMIEVEESERDQATRVLTATKWKDLPGFCKYLSARLLDEPEDMQI